MKTRAGASKSSQSTQQPTPKTPAANRPHLISKSLILPSNVSNDARFVHLENPRTGDLSRYYFCPKLGLYEFTAISSPSNQQRSMLFVASPHDSNENSNSSECKTNGGKNNEAEAEDKPLKQQNGLTSKHAQLLVATPVDLMFFLLPILDSSSTSKPARNLFQPLDDMIDERDDISPHLRRLLLHPDFKSVINKRMNAICDAVEAGEIMYRVSEEKLIKELMRKAERMVKLGLPPTLEERFVRRALDAPITTISREDSENTSNTNPNNDEANGGLQKADASQESTKTTASGVSPDIVSCDQSTPNTFQRLLRLRTALSFILSSYLSPRLSARIEKGLNSPTSPVDFKPLTEHLNHIANLRAEALASRSMFDMTRKRGLEDDEADEERAEKKRKQQEEEMRKKAGESRAVKELKKVNTSGMKKMSAFFAKSTKK